VQVAATTPQTTGGLLAVCPDVGEMLAVVALRKSILGFVRLYPDSNVAEVGQPEKLLEFRRSRQGDKEQWKVNGGYSFWRSPAGGCHLLDADDVKTQACQPVRNILSWSVVG
jgi:hypothetical protein